MTVPRITFVAAVLIMFARPEAASSQDVGSWTITGFVVDEQGVLRDDVLLTTPESYRERFDTTLPVRTGRKGVFTVSVAPSLKYSPMLIATTADGTRMGHVDSFLRSQSRPLRIVVAPVRESRVRIVGPDGDPLTGVEVEATLGTLSSMDPVLTDDAGVATLRLPPDAGVGFVYSVVPGVGFGYFENFDAWPLPDLGPLPGEVDVEVAPAEPVEIKFVDSDGQAVAGIETGPWTIQLPGKLTYVNGFLRHRVSTDDDGIARFDWIPKRLQRGVTFLTDRDDHHVRENPRVTSDVRSAQATAYRNGWIRGRVTHADGAPAAGVMLQGEGKGQTNMYYRRNTTTDERGRYELRPYPEQTLTIAVIDESWAARSHSGLKLNEGEVREDIDFELIRGTLVTGTVTVGPDKKPLLNDNATLIQDPDGGGLVRWAYTNEAGRYRFRVGPGNFDLMLPADAGRQNLMVSDQAMIVHDGHVDRVSRGKLSGVVLAPDGRPCEGATVQGESVGAPGHAGLTTLADDQGHFETERWNDDMLLLARDEKTNTAAVLRIGGDDREATIRMKPASRVTATLVDVTGEPIGPAAIRVSTRVTVQGDSAHFHFQSQIEEGGRVTIAALPRGSSFSILLDDPSGNRGTTLRLAARDVETTDLGEVTVRRKNAPGR